MKNQSIIEKLGFKAFHKEIIFHIDDIEFCHISNVASFECLDFGTAIATKTRINSERKSIECNPIKEYA
jgi:hypothetical protein